MVKYGFYITDKFPKAPTRLPDGREVIKLTEGAVIFYDIKAFYETPKKLLLRYCEELVHRHRLPFEPKEVLDAVYIVGIAKLLSRIPKSKIQEIPGIVLVEEREDA
ncbi:MAG TPA: hypothetical protein EYH49_03765 [Aquifex aeolicus]|nr:hypothetical protein [Aquifex aeolicus]